MFLKVIKRKNNGVDPKERDGTHFNILHCFELGIKLTFKIIPLGT